MVKNGENMTYQVTEAIHRLGAEELKLAERIVTAIEKYLERRVKKRM